MPRSDFTIPTLAELIERVAQDYRAELGEQTAVRRWVAYVFARAQAGVAWGLHHFIAWGVDQIFEQFADEDQIHRHASKWGIVPAVAVKAQLEVTFGGTVSSVIPAGAEVTLLDGTTYTVDAEVTYASSSETFQVTAVEAGADGNVASGQPIFLAENISGVDTEGETATAVTVGSDDETPASIRTRILERIRQPPQAGNDDSYLAWCKAALPTVVDKVWVRPHYPSVGDVTVYFSAFYDGSDPSSVIPGSGNVSTVETYVSALIPVTVNAFDVAAPIEDDQAFEIALDDDTAANRAAVTAQLVDLMQRRGAAYGGTTIRNEEVHAAIGRVSEFYSLVDVGGGGAGADIAQTDGSLVTVGTITWS